MKKIVLFGCLLTMLTTSLLAQSWSEKMAATVIETARERDSLNTDAAKNAKWSYDLGVVLKGIEGLWYKTGDVKYFNFMQKSMDFFVNDNGEIKTYKQEDHNIDNILCGRILLILYNVTAKEKYRKAVETLREQLRTQPRTNEGGFWHKKIYPNQMWLDGLYMGEPFYTEYAVSFNDTAAFNDIAHQFIWMEKHARDSKTGLLYHGWDESKQQKWANQQTGNSPNFWGRAMGWYGAALVDVLENFPATNHNKDSIIAILNRYAVAIKKVQDAKSGLWYDILDKPNGPGNYFEASAACMFVYTMAKGVRLGYLPASYLENAKKAYDAILKKFVETGANGQTNLNGTVSVSGLGGNPYRDGSYEYYMREKIVLNDQKGVGAFIQAANEMELIASVKLGKGKTVLLDDYYNAERKKDSKGNLKPFHYKWEEFQSSGFSFLGNIFNQNGVQTKTLSEAPTAKNLANTDIYFIVDADNIADNPHPNYVQANDATALYNWVKAGGVLVLFHNDKGNTEFEHFNLLAGKFGMHFNEDSYNRVIGSDYPTGAVEIPSGNAILPSVKKIYQKEICSITLKTPAKSFLQKNEVVVFAVAKIGKGTVFATGDPWLYNEYTDGRKIPMDYENARAANDLVKWLVKQVPVKTSNK